jgi:hypothetical protein
MTESKAKRLSEFAGCYDTSVIYNFTRIGLDGSWEKIAASPFQALFLFTCYAHERQGTSPLYQVAHRQAIRETCKSGDGATAVELDSNFKTAFDTKQFAPTVWAKFQRLLTKAGVGINEKMTRGPVKVTIAKLQEISESNIISFLTKKTLPEASGWLRSIPGIKEKISALALRDIACYFKKDWLTDKERWRLQPADRWVLRWAKKCWPKTKWKDVSGKQSRKGNHDDDSRLIVEMCGDEVDPVRWNQGAWFVGNRFRELCSFFILSESYVVRGVGFDTITKFDPARVRDGIDRFVRKQHEVFPV